MDIHSLPGKYKALDFFAIFCAKYLPILLVLFLFVYSLAELNLSLFFYLMVAALLGRGLNELVHLFYKEQRPFHTKNIKVLIATPKNLSFPSGHASVFFSMAFFLFFYNQPLAIIFSFLALLIGVARVYCGVHWWKDIFGSIGVGLISAFLLYGIAVH